MSEKEKGLPSLRKTPVDFLSPEEARQALKPDVALDATEAARLRVKSGWYGTKPSGTFVSGPHTTDEDCLRHIKTLGPVPDVRI